MNSVYYRIDDRLIHGQVITAWSRYYKLKRIIIVDDEVSSDPIQKQIINAVSPKDIKVEVLSVIEGYTAILDAGNEEVETLVLVKGPSVLCSLMELGLKIPEVIIGGMQYKDERKKISRTISATSQEMKEFWMLNEKAVELNVQIVPTDRKNDIIPILKKFS